MNGEIKNKELSSSMKSWLFLIAIIATIIIPQIIANQYNTEFAFGYPIGEEYKMVKAIAALIGMFLVGNFIRQFRFNKTLKIFLSVISLIPFAKLIIATTLCLLWENKQKEPKDITSTPWKEKAKDLALLLIGYFAVYNFIFGITGLLFLNEQDQMVMNVLKILVSALFFYVIYQRKIYLNQRDFIFYIIGAFLFTSYLVL